MDTPDHVHIGREHFDLEFSIGECTHRTPRVDVPEPMQTAGAHLFQRLEETVQNFGVDVQVFIHTYW